MQRLNEILDSKLGIAGIAFLLLLFLLWLVLKSGLFRPIRNVLADWSIEQKTGYHLFTNGSRIIILFTVVYIEITTHIEVTINPFHVKPIPFTEAELAILLSYVAGESYLNYLIRKNVKTKNDATNPEL